MDKDIKRIAIKFSILILFAMSIIGTYRNLSPDVCAIRAFIGAVATYITVYLVGKLISNIVIEQMAKEKAQKQLEKEMQAEKELKEAISAKQ